MAQISSVGKEFMDRAGPLVILAGSALIIDRAGRNFSGPQILYGLQQLGSKEYFVKDGSIRIGGKSCRGIQLCLSDMPDYMEVNFPTDDDNLRLAM